MALLTTVDWTLQASDLGVWSPSITTEGIIALSTDGDIFNGEVPVFPGSTTDWSPSIDVDGIMGINLSFAVNPLEARLRDETGGVWVFHVDSDGIVTLTSPPPLRWSTQPKARLVVEGA